MPQIFHPSTNAFAKATIFGAVFILVGISVAAGLFVRSPYITQVDVVRDQPVPFSHDHHAAGLGIDCRYCHTTVETSSFAGMPNTETCMGCHSLIWRNSPLLEPVRASWRNGAPLVWTRVYDLPDYVYFNHSIHVAKGVACENCHGRVDRMPLMRKVVSLHMEWCLDCHRHPENAVGSLADVFKFGRKPVGGATQIDEDKASTAVATTDAQPNLVEKYKIATTQLADCVICHR